ncbi:AAA family ATPase [Citroniella saccharovorans]|uniref:AAA family ATPase n=1 Tax=Citroniella saccharovorans TaxID=2053367 RepID=A0AAW9MYT1_9FIRM|nr:AAA family ATPase [Citroniella saccharovorans]MEB3429560.1 AAA family ATPase [Citroniella saccharovorans]
MKITRVKINGYRGLSEKEIFFDNGINVIYGENESGKSTILNFIENTLYAGVYENLEDNRPWFSSYFSGELDLKVNNNILSFNREFSKSLSITKLDDGATFVFDKNRTYNPSDFLPFSREVFNEISIINFSKDFNKIKNVNSLNEYLLSIIFSSDYFDSNKILINLDKEKNEIGTDRMSNKELGLINKDILFLEKSIDSTNFDLLIKRKEEILSDLENDLKIEEDKISHENNNIIHKKLLERDYLSSRIHNFKSSKLLFCIIEIFSFVFAIFGLIKSIKVLTLLSSIIFIAFLLVLVLNIKYNNRLLEQINNLNNDIELYLKNNKNIDSYEINILKNKIFNLRQEIEIQKEARDENNNYKLRILDKKKMRQELLDKRELIIQLMDIIDISQKSVIKKLLGDISKSTSFYLNKLTNGKYKRVIFDSDMLIKVYEEKKSSLHRS